MPDTSAPEINKSQQKLIPEITKKLARRDLENDDAPALVVYEAAKVICGPGLSAWETESVAQEFAAHMLKVSDLNLNKIWCLMALHQNRDVLTSAHVFQKIVLALNGEMPNPQIDELVEAEQMAWALVVLHIELHDQGFFFDYEPLKYMAQVLHGEGFVVAPKCMSFVQPQLARLNHHPELVGPVQEAYKKASSQEEAGLSGLIKSQLAKLQRVDDYVHIMHETMTEGLKPYRKA